MTEHALAQVDEVLTELVEMVETARTLPMSSSCVIGRERALDLLDALREVLPPELSEARRIAAQRERLLAESSEHAAESIRAASDQADQLVAEARVQAEQIVAEARREQERLVSSSGVQQAAEQAAAVVAEQAQAHADLSRTEADRLLEQATQAADQLTADAHGYATSTLSELVEQLRRLLATAENGRDALVRQRP